MVGEGGKGGRGGELDERGRYYVKFTVFKKDHNAWRHVCIGHLW